MSRADPKPAQPPERPRRPLWVRWVALVVFVAVLGVLFVNLGQWQLDRLEQRRAQNAVVRQNTEAPIADFADVFNSPVTAQDEWQRVRVTGTFDTDHQYVIRYRNNDDKSGYEVVTPLQTASGQSVLIDRGFVTVPRGEKIPTSAPAPPTGEVTIVGRARPDQDGRDSATEPQNGSARLIDSGKISADLGYPLVGGYIDVLSMKPADTVEFEQIALPELNEGPHFWYAVQWFMFTGIGVLGVVVFIRGDLRERRQHQQQDAAPAPQSDQDPERAETATDGSDDRA